MEDRALYIEHYILYNARGNCSVYNVQCILSIVYFTLHIVECALYIIYMYSVHCTMYMLVLAFNGDFIYYTYIIIFHIV